MVNVTTVGTYSITTNTADGISFSASGNFSDNGIQKITLRGNGTPDTTGVIIINTPGGTGCSFKINVSNPTPADFMLSGSPNNCENPDIRGDYVAGISMVGSNTISIDVTVSSVGLYSVTTDTVDGISFLLQANFP